MKQFKLKIIGKVQGVNFRFSTKAKADELGIKGLVKNMDDGTVYAEAAGEEDAVNKFIDWCRLGSSWAKVDEVAVEEIDNVNQYEDFSIVR
jgi:acylphosphatase